MARESSLSQPGKEEISPPSTSEHEQVQNESRAPKGDSLYSVIVKNKRLKAIAFLREAAPKANLLLVSRIFLRSLRLVWLSPFVAILKRMPFWEKFVFSHLNNWGKSVLRIANVRLRIINSESVSKDKTYLFASNHLSLLDIPVLCAAIPVRNRFVANKELSSFFITNFLMKLDRSILVDKAGTKSQTRALREIQQALLGGENLTIFPESSMSGDGRIQRFKRGGLAAAVMANVHIMPIGIKGTREACPPGAVFVNAGKEVQVIFGDEIDCKTLNGSDKKNINQLVYDELKKLTESAESSIKN